MTRKKAAPVGRVPKIVIPRESAFPLSWAGTGARGGLKEGATTPFVTNICEFQPSKIQGGQQIGRTPVGLPEFVGLTTSDRERFRRDRSLDKPPPMDMRTMRIRGTRFSSSEFAGGRVSLNSLFHEFDRETIPARRL
jgi:hypothetical protein